MNTTTIIKCLCSHTFFLNAILVAFYIYHGRAEPGYALPLQTDPDQLAFEDLDLLCLSFNM